jgi:hypothetical protein
MRLNSVSLGKSHSTESFNGAAGDVEDFDGAPGRHPIQDELLPAGQPWSCAAEQVADGAGFFHGLAVASSVWGWGVVTPCLAAL